jgi:hypothetical protein
MPAKYVMPANWNGASSRSREAELDSRSPIGHLPAAYPIRQIDAPV